MDTIWRKEHPNASRREAGRAKLLHDEKLFPPIPDPDVRRVRFISGPRWIIDANEMTPPIQSNLKTMATVCKHPRVRIVSRHDDAEFVECLECGEIFDSEEFHDMEIEDNVETEEAESEP